MCSYTENNLLLLFKSRSNLFLEGAFTVIVKTDSVSLTQWEMWQCTWTFVVLLLLGSNVGAIMLMLLVSPMFVTLVFTDWNILLRNVSILSVAPSGTMDVWSKFLAILSVDGGERICCRS